MTAALAHHWQLMLAAAAGGLSLGVVFVAVPCLLPLVRLRLATDPSDRARILEGEIGRLRRLGDAAAVSEEHGLPEAAELRTETELRTLLLLLGLHRAGVAERFRGALNHAPDPTFS